MLTLRPGFVSDLLAPVPGRLGRAIEISVACTIVMVVSMTYEIPETALSTYLIFFAAKENSGLNIVMGTVFIVLVSVIFVLLIPLTALTDTAPETRLFVIGALAFGFFFLSGASKLAPVANTVGLVVADVLYMLSSLPSGELSLRGLLYLPLVVGMPMAVFIAYNIVFGRRPDRLVRRAVAARLDGVAQRLRSGAAGWRSAGASTLAGGNAALFTALKMTALLQLQPPDTRDRLRDLVVLSYSLMMVADALAADGAAARPEPGLATRIQDLGAAVRSLPRLVTTAEETHPGEAPPSERDLASQMAALVGSMERVVAGGPRADLGPAPQAEKKTSRFFVPDAFSSPRHVRHAAKGTAAVLICYLTIVLLNWSKIATCIVTCFVVGLSSAGETTQKLTLRITGACIGGILGLATIVVILPNTTDIAGLSLLIALGALPAAWVAVGPPTVAYLGFQIAYAFFLCVLQGSAPAFDLTVARDRIIGVLFGDIVMFLIFANVYPASILGRLKGDVAALLGKCRSAVAAIAAAQPVAARAGAVAEAEALLGKIGAEAAAFGYETRRARDGRLQSHATRLSLTALQKLVGSIARLAAYPSPSDASDDALALRGECAAIDAHLGTLAARFSGAARGDEAVAEADAPVPPSDQATSGRDAAVRAVKDGIARGDAALARYGRLLRARGHADA